MWLLKTDKKAGDVKLKISFLSLLLMDVSGKDRDPALSLLLTAYSMCMPTVRAIYSTIYRYD